LSKKGLTLDVSTGDAVVMANPAQKAFVFFLSNDGSSGGIDMNFDSASIMHALAS